MNKKIAENLLRMFDISISNYCEPCNCDFDINDCSECTECDDYYSCKANYELKILYKSTKELLDKED